MSFLVLKYSQNYKIMNKYDRNSLSNIGTIKDEILFINMDRDVTEENFNAMRQQRIILITKIMEYEKFDLLEELDKYLSQTNSERYRIRLDNPEFKFDVLRADELVKLDIQRIEKGKLPIEESTMNYFTVKRTIDDAISRNLKELLAGCNIKDCSKSFSKYLDDKDNNTKEAEESKPAYTLDNCVNYS